MKYDLLMSIKPYYAYLIMKGIKTAEIRKSCHKGKDWSGKIKVYVSKDKKSFKRIPKVGRMEFEKYLGTVACEFIVNGITEFTTDYRQADNKKNCNLNWRYKMREILFIDNAFEVME